MTESEEKILALVNKASGTAAAALEALAASGRFDVREVEPADLEGELDAAVSRGVARVLVAGGDGTIATAARALLDGDTQLAVLPGGTLNHFARDLGLSTVAAEALETATGASCRPIDVGMVNDNLFLNTASVGAYVHFVQIREYLEKRFGYRVASALAALRSFAQLRMIAVEVEVDGKKRVYRTPLVFIGVGERELQVPLVGNRVKNGKRGLHVMIVRGRSRARVLAIALNAVARGVDTVAKTPELDSFMVDRCTIVRSRKGKVAIDGELVTLGKTLELELRPDAVHVVCP